MIETPSGAPVWLMSKKSPLTAPRTLFQRPSWLTSLRLVTYFGDSSSKVMFGSVEADAEQVHPDLADRLPAVDLVPLAQRDAGRDLVRRLVGDHSGAATQVDRRADHDAGLAVGGLVAPAVAALPVLAGAGKPSRAEAVPSGSLATEGPPARPTPRPATSTPAVAIVSARRGRRGAGEGTGLREKSGTRPRVKDIV